MRSRVLPWIFAGVALSTGVTAAALRVINGADPSGFNHYTPVQVVNGAAVAVLGSLIVRGSSRHVVGWFLVSCGVMIEVTALANEWVVLGSAGLPGSTGAVWVGSWMWLISFFLLPTVLLVIFPTGDAPSSQWRVVPGLIVAVWVVDSAWMMSTPFEPTPDGWTDVTNPFPWQHGPARLEDVLWWWPMVLVGAYLLVIGALVRRLSGAAGVERRQLMPFALAAVAAIAVLLADLNLGLSSRFLWIDAVATLLLPAGAAVGILYYRLIDVDRVVSRSVALLLVTVSVGAIYGVTLLMARGFVGDHDAATSALGIGLVAAAALPVWTWARTAAERQLFGQRAEPGRVLRRLGQQFQATADPDSAPAIAVRTIADSLRLPWVAINVDGVTVSEAGVRRGAPERFPIVHGDERFGEILVDARSDVDPLTASERQLIADLARHLAAIMRAGRLNATLHTARERLVLAREEERRRIRRDLHDGLGPQLAAVGLQLDIVANRMVTGDVRATESLATAKQALHEAIGDIRRLVEGLRPPALDEIGLASAIRQQLSLLEGGRDGDVEIVVDMPDSLRELPAAVEVASYRIVTEAVTNTLHHSGATRCAVFIRAAEHLDIVVRDDGRWTEPGGNCGVGLSSMRQRVEELGGTLVIDSIATGTTIEVRLPIVQAVSA